MVGLGRQLALVEVTAGLATGVQVYCLSSSIGDLLEDKKDPNQLKLLASTALAATVVVYFLISKSIHR